MQHRDRFREQLAFAREIGSTAASHAARAVEETVGAGVRVSEINSGLFRVISLMEMVTDPANKAVGVVARVEGKAPGHALFLFPYADAPALVDKVDANPDGTTKQIDGYALSVLSGLGGKLISSSLAAFSDETGLAFRIGATQTLVDMAWAVVSKVFMAALATDENAVMVASRFGDGPGVLDGLFLYIPGPGSLQAMEAARAGKLGIELDLGEFPHESEPARRLDIEPDTAGRVIPLTMWDIDYDLPAAA
ncbi:MAG: hypothetical protein KBC96_10675 [Armatimonadetes bacterium]|nr:hypothetical protein [Armatimonadota bacterium]